MCIRDSVEASRKANFRVAIDCVNSVGGIILPQLLEQLGVQHVEKLYCCLLYTSSLQLPGKKKLKTDELLRGFRLTEGYVMK